MASNLEAMASNLLVMASTLVAMASNLIERERERDFKKRNTPTHILFHAAELHLLTRADLPLVTLVRVTRLVLPYVPTCHGGTVQVVLITKNPATKDHPMVIARFQTVPEAARERERIFARP